MSKSWSESTKWLVIISSLAALVWLVYRFSQIISPLALAVILAYVLNPPVRLLTTRAKLPRTLAVVCIYLALIVILSLVIVAFVPSLIQQVKSINVDFQNIVEGISRFFERPLFIFGFYIDLLDVYQEVSGTIQSIVSPLASQTVSFLFGLASGVAWLVFVLIVSFYLLKDAGKLGRSINELVPADYRYEVRRLGEEVNVVWNAFFRSQLVLCAVVGAVVGVTMQVVGMRNALILGIIAGVLEIIPNIGPIVAAVPAVLIAYFQGSSYLSLSNGWFALLVIGLYVVIQQLENNILVPRIIGRSLNLHPLVVIIGALAGATLAGILGVFLAAPILASLRIVGKHIYCKLLDLEPFDHAQGRPFDHAQGRPFDPSASLRAGPSALPRAGSFPVQEDTEEPEPVQEEEGEVDAREEQVSK
ncbi:MAG: AI-2E family transporter [Anaerolineae bacterium]|nr:AI-2E family transporter [Anaerolineae bacterium]